MERIQLRQSHVVLITTILCAAVGGITEACEDWDLHGFDEVCCTRCGPGFHAVNRCGKKPSELCVPCEPDTYALRQTSLVWHCNRCTQCIGPQVQLKPCNASADTVCGCKSGFRCGDERCNYCVKECKEGEEPNERTCRKCPKGTFNDKIHSTCKPWTTSCPEGEQINSRGTALSDIKCSRIPETTTSTTTTLPKETTIKSVANDNSNIYALFALCGAVSGILIIFILSLWLAIQRTKNKTKNKSRDLKPNTPKQEELTIMVVAHEEPLSFHQPEQEQGGSLESINTQDSETKLIV